MIKKDNKTVGFIYKNNQTIDKIIKARQVVFEQGYTREQTGLPPITTSHQTIGKDLKDYKIYGNSIQDGTPTSTTPIEIESVGNKTKNLITSIFDGYFTNSVNTLTPDNKYKTFIAEDLPAGTYTFSTNLLDPRILRWYADGVINSAFSPVSSYTFTTTTKGKVMICVRNNSTTTLEDGIVGQYEIGSTVTDYEPMGYKIPVISRSKNILKPTLVANSAVNGVILSLTNDIYHLEGKATSNGGRLRLKTQDFYLKAGTYRFSIFSSNTNILGIAYLQSGSNLLRAIFGELVLTVESGYYNIGVNVNIDETYNVDFSLMIEKETTETLSYEPYAEPTTKNIYLDEPLRKTNDSDYIDFKNNKINRYTKESIYDGSENWALQSINSYGIANFYIYISNDYTTNNATSQAYINYFQRSNAVIANATEEGFLITSTRTLYIRINSSTASTVEEFKNWLNKHNLILDYVLNTPTEETISLPNIPTLKATTVFEIDTNVQPSSMYVKYKGK